MNKVALVTGASSGMGKEIARQLIQDGLVVYAVARRLEKMQDLAQAGAIPLEMDITSEEDIQKVLHQVNQDHEGVDLLVNNAGFGLYGAVEDTSIEEARYQFEVNLFGLARLTQLVLPNMREKKSGTIINISSMGGKIYTLLGAWYHASKHALEAWSDCLRLEVKPFGIDVVIVEPGIIDTGFGNVMLEKLMDRSGSTPYAGLAKRIKKATENSYKDNNASPPSVIAKVVSKAVKARKPRTRYSAGKMAKLLITLRHWLPDRWFDKVVLSAT